MRYFVEKLPHLKKLFVYLNWPRLEELVGNNDDGTQQNNLHPQIRFGPRNLYILHEDLTILNLLLAPTQPSYRQEMLYQYHNIPIEQYCAAQYAVTSTDVTINVRALSDKNQAPVSSNTSQQQQPQQRSIVPLYEYELLKFDCIIDIDHADNDAHLSQAFGGGNINGIHILEFNKQQNYLTLTIDINDERHIAEIMYNTLDTSNQISPIEQYIQYYYQPPQDLCEEILFGVTTDKADSICTSKDYNNNTTIDNNSIQPCNNKQIEIKNKNKNLHYPLLFLKHIDIPLCLGLFNITSDIEFQQQFKGLPYDLQYSAYNHFTKQYPHLQKIAKSRYLALLHKKAIKTQEIGQVEIELDDNNYLDNQSMSESNTTSDVNGINDNVDDGKYSLSKYAIKNVKLIPTNDWHDVADIWFCHNDAAPMIPETHRDVVRLTMDDILLNKTVLILHSAQVLPIQITNYIDYYTTFSSTQHTIPLSFHNRHLNDKSYHISQLCNKKLYKGKIGIYSSSALLFGDGDENDDDDDYFDYDALEDMRDDLDDKDMAVNNNEHQQRQHNYDGNTTFYDLINCLKSNQINNQFISSDINYTNSYNLGLGHTSQLTPFQTTYLPPMDINLNQVIAVLYEQDNDIFPTTQNEYINQNTTQHNTNDDTLYQQYLYDMEHNIDNLGFTTQGKDVDVDLYSSQQQQQQQHQQPQNKTHLSKSMLINTYPNILPIMIDPKTGKPPLCSFPTSSAAFCSQFSPTIIPPYQNDYTSLFLQQLIVSNTAYHNDLNPINNHDNEFLNGNAEKAGGIQNYEDYYFHYQQNKTYKLKTAGHHHHHHHHDDGDEDEEHHDHDHNHTSSCGHSHDHNHNHHHNEDHTYSTCTSSDKMISTSSHIQVHNFDIHDKIDYLTIFQNQCQTEYQLLTLLLCILLKNHQEILLSQTSPARYNMDGDVLDHLNTQLMALPLWCHFFATHWPDLYYYLYYKNDLYYSLSVPLQIYTDPHNIYTTQKHSNNNPSPSSSQNNNTIVNNNNELLNIGEVMVAVSLQTNNNTSHNQQQYDDDITTYNNISLNNNNNQMNNNTSHNIQSIYDIPEYQPIITELLYILNTIQSTQQRSDNEGDDHDDLIHTTTTPPTTTTPAPPCLQDLSTRQYMYLIYLSTFLFHKVFKLELLDIVAFYKSSIQLYSSLYAPELVYDGDSNNTNNKVNDQSISERNSAIINLNDPNLLILKHPNDITNTASTHDNTNITTISQTNNMPVLDCEEKYQFLLHHNVCNLFCLQHPSYCRKVTYTTKHHQVQQKHPLLKSMYPISPYTNLFHRYTYETFFTSIILNISQTKLFFNLILIDHTLTTALFLTIINPTLWVDSNNIPLYAKSEDISRYNSKHLNYKNNKKIPQNNSINNNVNTHDTDMKEIHDRMNVQDVITMTSFLPPPSKTNNIVDDVNRDYYLDGQKQIDENNQYYNKIDDNNTSSSTNNNNNNKNRNIIKRQQIMSPVVKLQYCYVKHLSTLPSQYYDDYQQKTMIRNNNNNSNNQQQHQNITPTQQHQYDYYLHIDKSTKLRTLYIPSVVEACQSWLTSSTMSNNHSDGNNDNDDNHNNTNTTNTSQHQPITHLIWDTHNIATFALICAMKRNELPEQQINDKNDNLQLQLTKNSILSQIKQKTIQMLHTLQGGNNTTTTTTNTNNNTNTNTNINNKIPSATRNMLNIDSNDIVRQLVEKTRRNKELAAKQQQQQNGSSTNSSLLTNPQSMVTVDEEALEFKLKLLQTTYLSKLDFTQYDRKFK